LYLEKSGNFYGILLGFRELKNILSLMILKIYFKMLHQKILKMFSLSEILKDTWKIKKFRKIFQGIF